MFSVFIILHIFSHLIAQVIGVPANVAAAKEGIQERIKELEAHKADMALRSFEAKVMFVFLFNMLFILSVCLFFWFFLYLLSHLLLEK